MPKRDETATSLAQFSMLREFYLWLSGSLLDSHGRVCGVVVAVSGFSARSGARTARFMIVGLRVRLSGM
jgi:hypothetical protein